MSRLGLFPRDAGDDFVSATVQAARVRFEAARAVNVQKLKAARAARLPPPAPPRVYAPPLRRAERPAPERRRSNSDEAARRTPLAWGLTRVEEEMLIAMLARDYESIDALCVAVNAACAGFGAGRARGGAMTRGSAVTLMSKLRVRLAHFGVAVPLRHGRSDVPRLVMTPELRAQVQA